MKALLKLFLVANAKSLFFVDHHQAELFKGDVSRSETMGADDDVDASLGQITDHGLLFRGLSKAAQMFDSDGIIRHAFAEVVVVLLC